jgi:hypothetical protein
MLQAFAIFSAVHGFAPLAIDNRVGDLVGEKYSTQEIWDYLLATIFEGLAVQRLQDLLSLKS